MMKNFKDYLNATLAKWNDLLKEYGKASSYAIHR